MPPSFGMVGTVNQFSGRQLTTHLCRVVTFNYEKHSLDSFNLNSDSFATVDNEQSANADMHSAPPSFEKSLPTIAPFVANGHMLSAKWSGRTVTMLQVTAIVHLLPLTAHTVEIE
jgi:hypothetical protein